MTSQQFSETQRKQILELIESFPWGDMEAAIRLFEIAFAFALESVGPDAIDLWEAEGEARFGSEFKLSPEQVSSLDDQWRLAYVARLLYSAAYTFGVVPRVAPGRSPEGEITAPLAWDDDRIHSLARLARGLNDILYGVYTPTSMRP